VSIAFRFYLVAKAVVSVLEMRVRQ